MGSWENSGWKGCREVPSEASCSKQHQPEGVKMWFSAFSSLVLRSLKDADSMASLGTLLHSGLSP